MAKATDPRCLVATLLQGNIGYPELYCNQIVYQQEDIIEYRI